MVGADAGGRAVDHGGPCGGDLQPWLRRRAATGRTASAIADLLLTEGRRLSLIATDDAHFSEPDHFGGWVMVKAEANEPEALLESLKAGTFYSSQGPELRDVRITGDAVEVECSAVRSVIVQGAGTAAKAVHGESLTGARVPLERFRDSAWIRVSVIDRAGKRAWSNPGGSD